jgi:hypothetical protein
MPLNTIPNKGLTSRGYPSDRLVTPIIINGDMSVAQRGTSTSSISNNTLYPCSDRFQFQNGNLGTWTASQDTNVPTGQGFSKSFKIACTTADATPAAGDVLNVAQKIEGQNLQHLKFGTSNADSLTVSFWVKCNKTGNGQVNLINFDANRIISNTYTINAVNTWEKKIIAFSGDTTGSIDNDNGASFVLEWYLDSGTDFSSGTMQTSWTSRSNTDRNAATTLSLGDSTSNYWQVTGVQLEVGEFDSTTIPSFPFESHESNLRKCQRYYFEINPNGANGGPLHAARTNGGSDVNNIGIQCPVPLRIGNPTVTIQSGTVMQVWTNDNIYQSSAGGGTTSLVNTGNDTSRLMLNVNGFSGMTGNRASNWGPVIASMPVDAEL